MCVLTLQRASLFTSENKDAAFVSCRHEEQKMVLQIEPSYEEPEAFHSYCGVSYGASERLHGAAATRQSCCCWGGTLQCCSENHKAEKIQVSIQQGKITVVSLSLCLCVPHSPSVTTLMVNLKLNGARKEDQHIRVKVCRAARFRLRADMFLVQQHQQRFSE